jgi:SAM-dependent methyltransferase
MNQELLEYLACPRCGGELFLDGASPEGGQVPTALACRAECGSYPVQSGVPRLLPELASPVTRHAEHQEATGRSFGAQWEMYEYGNTTWGVTVEERIQVVLHELEWQESDLAGKVILDAGCGNGTLSKALADRGATVVALDLSPSVFRAEAHCSGPNVHFVQGNLFCPPLRPGRFDAIYSCGVFHHTPDTRRCFDALVPVLKRKAEARYFVWLYAKRSALFNATVEPLMKVTRRMPSGALRWMCVGAAPLVEVASRGCTTLGLADYAPRNLKDRAVQLHDLLSPPYVWYHRYDEVARWAAEAGFRTIRRTDYDGNNQQPARLRATLRKYQTVCRPGFGILCSGPTRPRENSA